MKRRRPRKRRRSIGRRRKGTVGGGKDAKSKPRRVKHSPPEPPRLRPRRKPHHKSVSDVAKLDLSGEDLWRQRRVCIYVHWRDTFDCAPPACWKGKDGTIMALLRVLNLTKGSYKTVHKVLQAVWTCHLNGVEYVGDSAQVGCDPHNKPLIQPGSVEEQIVADAVEDNIGFTGTMHLVNSHIKGVDLDATHVGRSSIKTVVDRLRPKIGPIKSASQHVNITAEDPLGKARYEQLQQYRLRLGRVKLEDLSEEDQRRPAFANLDDHKFDICQVSFWDETHPSCRIGGRAPGPQQHIQRQFLRDINTGKIVTTKGINGDYKTAQRWAKVKYNKEIRLMLGCCIVKLQGADGEELCGRRLPAFDYTNRWVVTITQYEEECIPRAIRKVKDGSVKRGWVEGERTEDEGIFEEDPVTILKGVGKGMARWLARHGIKKVKQLTRLRSARISRLTKRRGLNVVKVQEWINEAKGAHSGEFVMNVVDHRKAVNPYESRYGDAWRDHIREDIRKAGSVCITELVRHMDTHTAAVYKGTEFEKTYKWYHDALTQLTCKRTRAWMEEEDLLKHWLLPVGPYNEGTVYYGRPVGNTPEIMPWDCSLNRDVHCTVEFYSAMSKWLPKDHPLYPRRFSKASYAIMRSSYLRVLHPETGVCPSSERIVQDVIKCWGEHLDVICAHGGAAVPELGNRVGKRRLEGLKKNRGGKRVKNEWKMLDNIHPDAAEAWKVYIARSREHHSGGRYKSWIR